jgi:serine/threonine protein kinase
MKGGTFLGEGTYGCTFSPAIPCQVESVMDDLSRPRKINKKLTKVYSTQSDLQSEWKYAKILKQVDPKQEYFIYPRERCEIQRKIIEKQPNANQCNLIKQSPKSSFPALQMMYGGMTFEQYVRTKQPTVLDFLRIARHILKGIRKLHQFGWLHQDLKLDNILVNDQGIPHMIDYSLFTPVNNAFNHRVNLYLRSKYWLHPPEYRIEMQIRRLGDRPSDAEISSFVNNIITEHMRSMEFKIQTDDKTNLDQYVLSYFSYSEYYNHIKEYVKSLIGKVHVIGRHAVKIDVYSLGLTFMNLAYYLKGDVRYQEWLKGMIHPDPRKRLSTTMAIRKINEMMK